VERHPPIEGQRLSAAALASPDESSSLDADNRRASATEIEDNMVD